MRAYHPIVEVYLQNLEPDAKLGRCRPTTTTFWASSSGTRAAAVAAEPRKGGRFQRQSLLSKPFGVQYLPDGFAAMTVPDWRLIDRQRYEFAFVRREFLGEARCFVFDVKPKGDVTDGFTGRIWVEDRDFNIVRFNGISRNVDHTLSSFFRKKLSFHVDSWRVNVLPGLWLPAYVYCEETDLSDRPALPRMPRVKSQIRLWGYDLKGAQAHEEFATIRIDAPTVQDGATGAAAVAGAQPAALGAGGRRQRARPAVAEAGLLAPAGPGGRRPRNRRQQPRGHQQPDARSADAMPRAPDVAARVVHRRPHDRAQPRADRRAAGRGEPRDGARPRAEPRRARPPVDRHEVRVRRSPDDSRRRAAEDAAASGIRRRRRRRPTPRSSSC